jgi:hypothetical protein
MLQRNAFTAFFQIGSQGRKNVFSQRFIEAKIKCHARALQMVRHQDLHVAPRILNSSFFQVSGSGINAFQHGGHR